MYQCQNCKKTSQPGEKTHVLVANTRPRTYLDEKGKEIGHGSEVVAEKRVCGACARNEKDQNMENSH